ncbi:vacuolar protein sorting-associated protein 21 isoform X1 [Drosophila miranda]|uniref:Vacuolar protein sorting-associated protein 21 isoform X1 n=2 Tax=Drosophila pseudoobscura pseudoobscura TaxID=46245 RepID=A0A6I8UUA0_DROPS|nr:vacuolar protein sorting-associated protein 21 isoform X1 [Drosophila pseudoobscura]XP_033247495.1 vacuolar protein sorting-associated protein 21 isoform X1 [Drosophila miranda]
MRGIEGKVVVLGSRGVGKTRLVIRYIKNTLHRSESEVPTIAVSFFTCNIILDEVKIKLQIWDTAGQERYRAVAPMYYRNANAAILVFDLTQYKTFTEIKSWIQELHRNVQDPMILTLVGNKMDMQAQRAVSRDEAFLFATSIGATYFETSTETDQGLEQVFLSTALGMVRLADEGKSHSLRSFESTDSLAYTNTNTAFSHTVAALARSPGNAAFRLPYVDIGLAVEGEDVKTNGVGRLETPPWSIEHIALGEVERPSWCCY